MNVGRIMVERRERANNTAHDRHRVRIAPKPTEENRKLFIDHGVAGDRRVEIGFLGGIRQFALQQQIRNLQKIGLFRQFLNRVAAMQKHALVAINIGQARQA